MDTKQYGRLSLGEQIYIWLFIYVLKTKFYLGQSSPEYATGCYFGLLQGLNFLVICHFIILTYIIHSGFISGYQNRYGDNLKPPTNVYHRMTA